MHQKNPPLIAAIVATAENRVIGRDNQLPWHLPADLQHFKRITTGHPILMGRKTCQSIGRPLPGRTNIVLSRDENLNISGCQVVSTFEQAIQLANVEHAQILFIIGGAEIYRQLLSKIDRLYLTIVHQDFEGDSFFPELDQNEWHEVSREKHQTDEKNPHDYSFVVLERK